MANNRNITDLPNDIFTHAIPEVAQDKEATAIMGTLASTGKYFHGMFQDELLKRALFQAVIDDDCDTIKRILNVKPELLLIKPPTHLVIESKLTWQKFYAEKLAVMAAKRKQSEIFALILSYYDNLPQTDDVIKAKAEAISAWSSYEINKNAQGEDEIVIPKKYADLAKSLIDVFSKETFPNGSNNKYGYGMLSKETEDALSTLFNLLLPERAVKLDDYLDVELLLLATAYKAYWDHFDTFNNWNQRDAFCNRVIGLIQSVQAPKTAEILCEGLDNVVGAIKKGEKKEISPAARLHKLMRGEPFYRSSRCSSGLGFDYFCGIFGEPARVTRAVASHSLGARWNTYVKQKHQSWKTYYAAMPKSENRWDNRAVKKM